MAALGALVLVALAATVFATGCRRSAVEVVSVETVDVQTGKNLAPLRDEVLSSAERGVEAWIGGEGETVAEVFTDKMMAEWNQARALDREDGVRRVRVHSEQEYVPTTLTEERPRLRYEFVDESYFVDELSGEPVSEPRGEQRQVVITLVRQDGTYKVDQMVGLDEALR